MLAPIFGLLLAGAVDLGGMISSRFSLDGAVSAGANYALVSASNVSSAGGAAVAANIGAIIASTSASASGTVVVNNGPQATVTNGAVTTSGTAANADACYCPTLSASTISWGAAITPCGTACTGAAGGFAGKFVAITAQQTYVPILIDYGFTRNSAIHVQTVVQVK